MRVRLVSGLKAGLFLFFMTAPPLKALGDWGPLLESEVFLQPAANEVSRSSVAFDGQRYLVVWEQLEHVYGWFLDRSGNPVGDPFPIVTTPGIDKVPVVASNGDHYLVAWVDALNSTINATVVTVTGSLPANDMAIPIVPISPFGPVPRPAIASNGHDFLIVWDEGTGFSGDDETDLTGCLVRVDPDGSVVPTVCDIPLGSPEGDYAPSVAFGKESFLVTWFSGSYRSGAWEWDIFGRIVSSDGQTVSDEFAIATGPLGQTESAVSSDGTNFLVAWQDNRNGLDYDLYAARVSESGALLDDPPIPVNPDAGSGGRFPRIAHNGQNWLIVWQEDSSELRFVFGTQIASDGSVLEPSSVPISVWSDDLPYFPAVASDGENFLVAWSGFDENTLRIQLVGTIPPRIKPLRDRVVSLMEAGSLGKHGKQLTGALDRAESHLAKGLLGPALQQLEHFIQTVERLAWKSEIDLHDANELTGYAKLIIYHRTRPDIAAGPVV
ncbi:MAG TPA: hypothetical protein PLP42_13000 [Acidobacteriota bacterium]|nr:hypothetical protein [Acidobacteriota bacterium]